MEAKGGTGKDKSGVILNRHAVLNVLHLGGAARGVCGGGSEGAWGGGLGRWGCGSEHVFGCVLRGPVLRVMHTGTAFYFFQNCASSRRGP